MPDQRPLNGILPVQHLQQAIHDGAISAEQQILPAQLQPASLDLRLAAEAWRLQASFLPAHTITVAGKLAKFALHYIDLTAGAVIARGSVYI